MIMKRLDTDIAIVGGGSSGLAAAVSAAEKGARVMVFEKTNGLPFGGVGTFAVESHHQRSRRIAFTKKEAVEMFLRHAHYRSNARLLGEYVERSADTLEWLEAMGVLYVEPIAYYAGAQFTWHLMSPESPRTTGAMATRAQGLGAVLHMQTPVKELVKKNGRVRGLLAEDSSGAAVQVDAKAVIVGTGGFSENADWIKKYTAHALGKDVTLTPNDPPKLHGDGIRMAWEVGAASTYMCIDTYRGLPQPFGGPGGTQPELGVFRQPLLMVNQDGERFVNEEIVTDGAFSGNAVGLQKNSCGYVIFDEDTNRYYEQNDWDWILPMFAPRSADVPSIVRKAQSEGYQHLFLADSVEDLSAQTGIALEGLRSTLNEYNRMCETGRDPVFYKDPRYLKPVRKPPFYAGRFMLNGYVSLGGVRINHRIEALDENLDPIPGLYVAGNDSNDLCGDTYVFFLAGHMSGFAFHSGRTAGENAVGYLSRLNG
jgi:fumarate reductase flavoprotein subunit